MKALTYSNRVLLIEDNPGFRFLFKDALESLGCEVLEAEDGEIGVDIADRVVPEVILLDLMIPKLHGFEVLAKLRSNIGTKNIPVIVLSVLNEPKDIQKSFQLGATEYIVKGSEPPLKIANRCVSFFKKTKDPARSALKTATT